MTMRGEGRPTLVNQRSQVRRVSWARSARAVTVPQGRLECLHDLLRGALLQLAEERAAQRGGRVFEAVDDHPPDTGPPELEQHRGVGRGQVGVDQQGQRRKEKPKALDAVGTGCPARQERIHDRHVDRLGPDRLDGLGPPADRDPLEPVGIQGPQPEQALRRDGGEQQVSQIGP
jgi:hypothetical protein